MTNSQFSQFFQPAQLGPLTLRNRSIRSAAFEGMCQGHQVTDELIAYHSSVAKGGVGMTTVAYAAVNKGGLSFPHQLWLREEIIPDLKKLTQSVHQQGAKVSIQIGHCGNMADRKVTKQRPIAPTGGTNWYGPTFPRTMKQEDIDRAIRDFQQAVGIAAASGFDAVEVHAGHGYLISQFLSPYTNKRKDQYGGAFDNRSRFMREVLQGVKAVLPAHMALLVKMNSHDGFMGGITETESIQTAKMIEACGADAIIVSGGFVSKSPMFILRGKMPIKTMAHFMKDPVKSFFARLMGKRLIPEVPFKEGYFLDEAIKIKKAIHIPVAAVGGMNSKKIVERALDKGIDFIVMARALIKNPNFINDLKTGLIARSDCTICNYCVAKINGDRMSCHFREKEVPEFMKREIEPGNKLNF